MNTHSISFRRERRLYTVLPLLVIPCVTFIFWILGGGSADQAIVQTEGAGFNASLPEPFLRDGPSDKLAFYEKADRDSAALRELQRADPYYSGQITGQSFAQESRLLGLPEKKQPLDQGHQAEAQINQKLEELKTVLAAKQETPPLVTAPDLTSELEKQTPAATDLDRLEKLVESIHAPSSVSDPEMAQLDQMLEKVLDIQYPERVEDRLAEQSRLEREKVFAVTAIDPQIPISCMACETELPTSLESPPYETVGFYGLDDEFTSQPPVNLIEAVVHETQEIVAGSTVKLRLTHEVFIAGVLIPKDELVYGIAVLNGERLQIQIKNIRYGQTLFPVALRVFDLDGLDGIHIPGAITRDAAKQSGDRAIQSVGLSTFDRSIGAQATAAGIELSRNLLSRKVKLIRVTVKAGYQVLLRDDKQIQV
ncbi:MAG: conjugative transposon protein TraM [Cytophagaceae bacterium SCN 52-12]|nr:MAG: conjugative transposon protein TraM [Cytophagaceae bacterium SCN 52-12]